ncbi:hypothetical protein [Runella salmonicolor]|uniref:Uma2 family endonuclease n=1 Tax=Runella salmonicolor TaxID=2950278 RepID=A0ABT1FKS9_9BACT|nr:hypothetical protein [Runella salmonicolor]MCP1382317.1 hypothetical protein [Runella salmonicolor]
MATATQQIPESLIYEEFGGRVYYRRGYRQVVSGLKTEEEIMGSSVFQSLIIQALVFYLKTILPKKLYWVPTNEAGLHLNHRQNLANDIVIVEKSTLKDPFSDKYSDVPPKFIVEVDIKIDPKEYTEEAATGTEMDYILEKSGQLLDFGVEGIVWVLTKGRRIILIKSHRIVEVFQWHETVPLFDDYSFCLQRILEDEDILPATA